MTTYYDFVLGFIPLALFGLSGGLSVLGLPLESGLFAGGLLAIALMGHALFVNAPGQDRSASNRQGRQHPTPSERRSPHPTSD